MNNIPAPRPHQARRAPRWLGSGLSWLVLLIVIALVLFQLGIKYLLAPAVKRTLDESADRFTAVLGVPVEIGFADLDLNLGLSGIHLNIIAPVVRIGTDVLAASEANLAYYLEGLPVLEITDLELSLVQRADGQFAFGQLVMPQLAESKAVTANMNRLVPFDVISTNTQLNLTVPAGQTYSLKNLDIGVHSDVATEQIQVSFTNGYTTELVTRGRINFEPLTHSAHGYVRIIGAERLLPELLGDAMPLVSDGSRIEIWAEYANDELMATIQANAHAIEANLTTLLPAATPPAPPAAAAPAVVADPVAPATRRARIQDIQVLARTTTPLQLNRTTPLALTWQLHATEILLDPGEPVLGGALVLDALTAAGDFDLATAGWQLNVPALRFSGPLGLGQVAIKLSQAGAALPQVDVRATVPHLDATTLTQLLPRALSATGVDFLRHDLQIGRAQAPRLIVRGSDFSSFPWPDRASGEFRVELDFFDTVLDYGTGYPPLRDASGTILLDGSALAVTIVAANVGPAEIAVARAGVDDLTAPASTLYVAADATVPAQGLFSLLRALPDTRRQANSQLGDLVLTGGQRLDLAVVVPLDTDDPIAVSGALTAGPNNALTYTPLELTLSALEGTFNFDRAGVRGIGYGELLGAGVRLSLAISENEPLVRLDGTFDLADVLARLELAPAAPLRGRSEVAVLLEGHRIDLRSELRGTAIDLPPPLGKPAANRRPLAVQLAATGTQLDYDSGFLRAALSPQGEQAIVFNSDKFPVLTGTAGSRVSGAIPQVDLDALAATIGDGGGLPLRKPIALDLQLPAAQLLGLTHPQLHLTADFTATTTIALIEAAALAGQVQVGADKVIAISVHHLYYPETEPQDYTDIQTIVVEPGVLTPVLPPLALVIDELVLGEHTYLNLQASGAPDGDRWNLTQLVTRTPGANTLSLSGSTATAGEPHTAITISGQLGDLEKFIGNYSDSNSIKEGTGALSGTLSWAGALTDPHLFSLQGELNVEATRFILNQESGGARLLNLLSPFTLLQDIGNEMPADGFLLESAKGKIRFTEGQLVVAPLDMTGPEIDIKMTGSTNMITRRNNITSLVKLNRSGNVTAAAATVINPLAGAFILLFDKVLNQPLLGDFELKYSITGTWDEPQVDYEQIDDSILNLKPLNN